MKKRTAILVIALLIYGVTLGLVITAVVSYNSNKQKKELEKIFDDADQDMAIEHLIELRGRILEVKDLSNKDIPQSVLLDVLESITSSNDFTNKYLDDFAFDIPNTSNVGELCEELISQINNQIRTIEYGAKGE